MYKAWLEEIDKFAQGEKKVPRFTIAALYRLCPYKTLTREQLKGAFKELSSVNPKSLHGMMKDHPGINPGLHFPFYEIIAEEMRDEILKARPGCVKDLAEIAYRKGYFPKEMASIAKKMRTPGDFDVFMSKNEEPIYSMEMESLCDRPEDYRQMLSFFDRKGGRTRGGREPAL